MAPACRGSNPIKFAKEIEGIEIDGDDERQTLIFVIKNSNNKIEKYPSDRVHELPQRFVALPKHWFPHINTLKTWNDTLWTQNSCVIPAYEACEWFQAVEAYAILGISIASTFYNSDIARLYVKITELLKHQNIDNKLRLPSECFPKNYNDITLCPVCKLPISADLNRFRKNLRENTWQPAWRPSKKDEGDDASIQIMHVKPLVESEIRHSSENVRYGHRWCNIAMTDHSLDETLDFMEFVVKAHNRL